MSPYQILVVDDEPVITEIIRETLDDPAFSVDVAMDGDSAWEKLATSRHDLVILDRMMLGMDGIELLRRMKKDDRLRCTPVIMQTVADSPEQVREGIEAGAYYYLTKPYRPDVLLAIVRAALADLAERITAKRHAAVHIRAMEMLDEGEFHFGRSEEIGPLIEVLASLCPNPEKAAAGLTELLINAHDHGNLGISYEEKKHLRLENVLDAEVARRQTLKEFVGRRVRVRVRRLGDGIQFTISDEGNGFDWQRYLEFDLERIADPNGRGIALARRLYFNDMQYLGSGNTVVVNIRPE